MNKLALGLKQNIMYFFSSTELIISYLIILYTVMNQNIYGVYLLFVALLKNITLFLTKEIFRKYSFSKRPPNPFNCNVYNCGGISKSPGYPSGHMTNLGIYFAILYSNICPESKNKFLLLSSILVITTGIGRYYLNCHTLFQIISGLLFGLMVGYLINQIEGIILINNEKYQHDKEIFYQQMNLVFS